MMETRSRTGTVKHKYRQDGTLLNEKNRRHTLMLYLKLKVKIRSWPFSVALRETAALLMYGEELSSLITDAPEHGSLVSSRC
jgi:hypothetical protein